MSGWTVPLSSSPQVPSTPGSDQRPRSIFANSPNATTKGLSAPNPSTTPAGPPPSSVGSFTPADPPPSSIFGSSQIGSGKTLFKSKVSSTTNSNARKNTKPISSNSISQEKLARFLNKSGDFDFGVSNGTSAKNKFGVLSNPSQGMSVDEEEESYEDESEASEERTYAEGSEEEATIDIGAEPDGHSLDLGSALSSVPNRSLADGNSVAVGSSIMDTTPRGIKRSRGSSGLTKPSPRSAKNASRSKHESAIPSIAKSMVTQRSVAKLVEQDDFIVGTESIIQQDLYGTEILSERHQHASTAQLPIATERLSKLWQSCCDRDMAGLPPKQEIFKGIGPDEDAPQLHKAVFLGALLIQLHHPPNAKGKQSLALARTHRSSVHDRASPSSMIPSNPTAFPKVLIDWLKKSHDPYGPFNIDVQKFRPNPTAHFNYWDLLFSYTLRGKLADMISLLKRSDFRHARTAKDDRKDGDGYSEVQVRNIERVTNRAIQLLEYCPALQDDDWNITGNEWIMFRKRVEQSLNDLATFAEGRDRDMEPTETAFEASNFGLRSAKMGLSQSARRAESQVPWTIYQNLKAIYGILLGETTEILAMAQDWVEATVALTVWWVGDDDEDVAVGSVALTRRSLRQSKAQGTRLVDVNPSAAYLRRLALAFGLVDAEGVDEKGLALNTLNQVEVGLASVFEGNTEGVLGFLRTWSLPVASAVAEIASAGGWLETQTGVGVMNGLDESDLLLLSRPIPPEQALTKDVILSQYAEALSYRGHIQASAREIAYEGWELSISVLTRLDDESKAAKEVSELLLRLPKNSDVQVDMILRACERFRITKDARSIAENYADHVIETTDNYGTALIYFARAHLHKKVKAVLDLLISISLVQSKAYPPLAAMDLNLHAFIFEPQQSLGQLALVDSKAAEMLHTYMTGYASLRRFYDLRDEKVQPEDGQKSGLRPLARKRATAMALLAVINSAADNIHGGLYDEDRGAVVQVDGLLALLGEAMVFVNQPGYLLPQAQCFILLKAIEDLQTVTPRVYAQCEECFKSTLEACQGRAAPASPRELLKKTMSSMTSSFSLVGDSMIQSESSNKSTSKALVKSQEDVKRGWDWRKGLGEKAKGEDVLRVLRLGLAKDIAKHWIAGEGS